MDDPNMTMEEYIKLEEEKARRRGWVFNREIATYGKIRIGDDLHDLRYVEAEFPAIVIKDAFAPQDALPCKSQVSTPVNDDINFRISFDESDDEDYTIICDKNSFSYKMIFVNNLKSDSENDNEKAVILSFLPPKPTISYVDDLDFFKDFKNEFLAIVYNDAQTSKSDYLNEHTLSPRHNNESDLNNETSFSEYDEVGQNVLYFNDLFPFNVIHPDDLKSVKDNDNNEIDIIQSLEDMALPPRDHRHLWLRYQVEGYTEEIVYDFEQRLETIFGRQVNRVHILDFEGLTPDMRHDLVERMRVVYIRDDGQEEFILEFFDTCRIGDEMGLDVAGTLFFQMGGARRSMTWRQFILALGLYTAEEMAEDGFRAYWLGSERLIPDKGDLSDYWVEISSGMDFLRGAPSYTYIRDPVRRLCHILISYSISRRGQAPEKVTATDLFYLCSMDRGAANVPYLLAQYLFRHAEGRKSGARLSRGYFIGCLAHHFGLVHDDGLRGLSVVAHKLPLIDMERQQVAVAGAPAAAEDAPAIDEGNRAILAPVQAPQPPPPPPSTARTMP
ncbi:hypothetical protein Tco_0452036 [Tanacetum coccineum]